MPGMNTGLGTNNPDIVSAFQSALLHQGLIVLLLVALVAVAWNFLRAAQLRRAADFRATAKDAATRDEPSTSPDEPPTRDRSAPTFALGALARPEPSGRRVLRVGFGLLWLFDGILQGQASMPLGLVPQVVQPPASASPRWVQDIVNVGGTVWSYHPVTAAAAAVWIQVGIGVWLLAARRGEWSRLAGLAAAGWGLTVFVFGEAFGGIFAPGLSWLFGAPGAALFYSLAGALVALPERAWDGPRLGRLVLRSMGAFFIAMAVLQAWPGRGFWQGRASAGAAAGSLAAMVQEMSQTPQPGLFSSWVAAFARFDAAHGWAVNLFVVAVLAALGAAYATARPAVVRPALAAGTIFCLATWVLVQDLGFMGGVGTDPNSMVPILVVLIGGYLAVARAREATAAATVVPIRPLPTALRARWAADPAYAFRNVAAIGALGVTLVGAVPLTAAAANPRADPILAQAVDGTPVSVDKPAPLFSLVDQAGRRVSLSTLRGKVVALTFLDDTCTTDCPVIAQEFRLADGYLGAQAKQVDMVAVNVNPRYLATDFLVAFDHQEGLQRLPNWTYLTGTLAQLRRVWAEYGEQVLYLPAGAMVGHDEFAYVIDKRGDTRYVLDTDPGPSTKASKASFASTLSSSIKNTLAGR
jgi:cytochrome oxidase Cu insertion factor (SCO1/SenC/PrrC family)